jgi:dolichol-phosphate mannosyltransferase
MNQTNRDDRSKAANPGALPTEPKKVLTILMPAHNEADIIAAAVTEWHAEVIAKIPGSRLLVIDDASTDRTPEVLGQLTTSLPGFDFIHRDVNVGHGKALRFGFSQVETDFVFQTDSDRQHRPSDFWRLWELRDQYDFVFGVRAKRQDGGFRLVVTTLMRVVNWLLWQVWISDANCPFKLMRRDALTAVLKLVPEDSFIPMVMVSILARRMRFRVTEVRVEHLPRRGGTQSLRGMARWARVTWRCTLQLARLRFRLGTASD